MKEPGCGQKAEIDTNTRKKIEKCTCQNTYRDRYQNTQYDTDKNSSYFSQEKLCARRSARKHQTDGPYTVFAPYNCASQNNDQDQPNSTDYLKSNIERIGQAQR